MPYYLRGGDLQVFETPDVYHSANSKGYWGDVTSTIDWCERNYVVTYYIAEFHNTWSNILFVLLGLFGLIQSIKSNHELRTQMMYATVILVGVGSAGFHGTLLNVWQQGDETPMVLCMLVMIYNLVFLHPQSWTNDDKKVAFGMTFREAMLLFLIVFALFWTVLHFTFRFVIVFQLCFGAVSVIYGFLLAREVYFNKLCTSWKVKSVGAVYAVSIISAFLFWQVDVNFCDRLNSDDVMNPQLHAWWHILCGISCYCCPIILSFQRAQYLQLGPTINLNFFIPVVNTKLRLQ